MKNIDKIKVEPGYTIKQALSIIDSGAMRIALVVDKKNKLLGTITDGDIRRGLLRGLSLDDSIDSVIYKNPLVCNINDDKDKIKEIALKKKIYHIPIVNNHGILLGIEGIDELLGQSEYPNKVVLMAGGLGTRLRPMTNSTPKPMLHVGQKPILETIIHNFSRSGFKNFILSVNYKSSKIIDYFEDGNKLGVNIEYVHEEKRLGTAGALALMKAKITQPFFVMNGDILTNINFENFYDYHLQNQAIATMAVREYDFEVPYGVVDIENSKITSIEEKPVNRFYVNAGIYMLNPQCIELIPDNTYFDMTTLFQKIISKKLKSISFPIREYWLDIGKISHYHKANAEYESVFEE